MELLGDLFRKALLALLVGEARVSRPELQVGYQSVKKPISALDNHKAALLHILWWYDEPGAQVFL